MNNLFKKALISEKSFRSAAENKVTFIVDKHTDKETVAKACQELFKVSVVSCNSMNYKGKVKQTRKNRGKRSDFKKVILTLKPGEKIDLFEIEAAEEKEVKKAEKKEKKAEKEVKTETENKDVEVKIKEKKK